jgi:amino acid transporter
MSQTPDPAPRTPPSPDTNNGIAPDPPPDTGGAAEGREARTAAPTVRRVRSTRTVGRVGTLMTDGTRLAVGDLERGEIYTGTHPGDRVVRRVRPTEMGFKKIGPGHLEALPTASRPTTTAGRIFERLKRIIIGSPLSTAAAAHERLSKVKALAVLSSDALSSVTYATEAILATLLIAGTQAFGYNVPIALAIAVLIGIVVFSYRQTIYSYPKGGGSYIVSKDNLGTLPGLIAGASLSTGYILTVSVSIAAGVANLISLLATVGGVDLRGYRVEVALVAILILVLLNLRGIRESGTIFSAPTYIFLVLMFGMIGLGLFQYFNGTLGMVKNIPDMVPPGAEPVVGAAFFFLLLRAFASGCAALTGIEAISDGVAAFQRPEAKNATITLTILGVLLGTMFLGISFLADHVDVRISETETVVSQLGRTIYGLGPIYTLFLIFTSLLLVLAANTAFADFPRLGFFLARDKFLPHQFTFRGDRLAFSFGIITLGVLAGLLIFVFEGETDALLPLYAIGVFTSFTLSQSGMVIRWWRNRPPGWPLSLAINAIGATTTALVTLILAFSGFARGAWMVLIIVPLMVLLFLRIHKHYTNVSRQISLAEVDPIMGRAAQKGEMIASAPEAMLPNEPTAAGIHPGVDETLRPIEHLVIIPISAVNQVTLRTVAYARSITKNVVGVHVASDEEAEEVAELEARWKQWVADVPLVVVESPYRSLTRPLLAYIDALHRQQADRVLTVVLPEFVPAHWWEHLLHNQTALRLKGALLGRPGIVVISVPYHLDRGTAPAMA